MARSSRGRRRKRGRSESDSSDSDEGSSSSDASSSSGSESSDDDSDDSTSSRRKKKSKSKSKSKKKSKKQREKEKKKKKSEEEAIANANRLSGWRGTIYGFMFLFNVYQVYMFLRTGLRKDLHGVKSYALYRLYDSWYYDFRDLRADFASEFLMKGLGLIGPLGYLTYIISWVGLTLFGDLRVKIYKKGWYELERRATKTAFIDKIVSSVEAKQLVILGAELDTRAYNEELLNRKIDTIYEVGDKELLRKKRKVLKQEEFDTKRVIYVGTDMQDDWGKPLSKNGFDPSRTTVFVCEDLMHYYDEEFAEDALGLISDYMEQNSSSVFVFDYYDQKHMSVCRRLLTKRLTRFEVPGKASKKGRQNLSKWIGKHSLYVHDQVRMENLGYGIALVSLLESKDSDYSSDSDTESDSSSGDSESDSDSD